MFYKIRYKLKSNTIIRSSYHKPPTASSKNNFLSTISKIKIKHEKTDEGNLEQSKNIETETFKTTELGNNFLTFSNYDRSTFSSAITKFEITKSKILGQNRIIKEVKLLYLMFVFLLIYIFLTLPFILFLTFTFFYNDRKYKNIGNILFQVSQIINFILIIFHKFIYIL